MVRSGAGRSGERTSQGADLLDRLDRLPWRFQILWMIICGLVHVVLAFTSVQEKGILYDDLPHLTGGYTHLAYGDYRYHPEAGLLPKTWAALPLVVRGVEFPGPEGPYWNPADTWMLGHRFFFEMGHEIRDLIRGPRGMMLVFSFFLVAAVFFWSRQLFGFSGGALSAVLMAFSPGFLAHGPAITADMTSALFFLLSTWTLWNLCNGLSWSRFILAAGAVTLAALSKMSAPLVGLIGLILAIIAVAIGPDLPVRMFFFRRSLSRRISKAMALLIALIAVGATAYVGVWAAYGFRFEAFAPDLMEPGLAMRWDWAERRMADAPGWLWNFVVWSREVRLLPDSYIFGVTHSYIVGMGVPSFMNGQYSFTGWATYFPFAFLVKTPIPTLIAMGAGWVALAIAACGRGVHVKEAGRQVYRLLPLLVLFGVYALTAMSSHINIGLRHILIVYPPLFILSGASLWWLNHQSGRIRRLGFVVVGVIAAALAFESLRSWPHYMAYFNQFVGGSANGYKHLVDSNSDWGQDLPALEQWLEEKVESLPESEQPRVYLAYFGADYPEAYDMDFEFIHGAWYQRDPLPLTKLRGGIYCISASLLQGYHMRIWGPAWTKRYEEDYRMMTRELLPLIDARFSEEEREAFVCDSNPDHLRIKATLYRQMQLARLCAMLRQREPDDRVAHSILVYRLTDADLQQALFGSPVELRDVPWEIGPDYQ